MLTVSQVIHTSDFTRGTVTASNDRPNSIILPLFQNCTLRGAGRTTLQADSFRSDWSETLAPGTHGQRGVVVFPGHLPSSLASRRSASRRSSRPASEPQEPHREWFGLAPAVRR